jgi:hypothetical protein
MRWSDRIDVMRLLLLAALGTAAIGCGVGFTGNAQTDGGAGSSVGGNGGNGGSAGAGAAGGTPVVLEMFAYQRRITVTALSAPIPAGYAVSFVLDHAQLVADSKVLANGDDLRIMRTTQTDAVVEVHRVVDPASAFNTTASVIWFATAQDIAASATDNTYFLVYGADEAGAPKDDPTQVYQRWDGFDGDALDAAWTFDPIGGANGTATLSGGKLRLASVSGDIWGAADNFVLLHHPAEGAFVVDCLVSAHGGDSGGWAKLGGVTLRQTIGPGSRNRLVSPLNGAIALTNSWRLSNGDITVEDQLSGGVLVPHFTRLIRTGDVTRAFHSEDGQQWTAWGDEITFTEPLNDPIRVGIPFASDGGSNGWVEIDWYRVMPLVRPEPTVTLGEEQTATQ